MLKYQLSPHLRIIDLPQSRTAMAYHALYGNPRLVSEEGKQFLQLLRHPLTLEEMREWCEGDPAEMVREFAEIRFLVDPTVDERQLLQDRKKDQLARLCAGRTVDRMGLAISNLCNFGCRHCIHFQPCANEGHKLPIYEGQLADLNMSWDTAKRCVDHYVSLIRQQGTSDCKINFGNAEPLLNWPVVEQVLDYCGQIEDLSFQFVINTNLALMTREIAETLKYRRVRIATSLDGTQAANDAVRITKNGEGTFSRIVEKFDLLEEIGYPLDGFSITVTEGNFDLVDTDVLDLAIERGMISIAFDYDLIGLVRVPVEERVSKLIRLKRYANEHGVEFFGTWDSVFRNLTSGSLLDGSQAFCAGVQGKALEFDVNGQIKTCSHTTTSVGHVDRFGEVFSAGGRLADIVATRFPGSDAFCHGCEIEGPCGGQCHVTREVVSRSTGEERDRLFSDMCDFYRAITRELAVEYIISGG